MTEASGIVGNTQQAAVEATVAREATKVAWQEQIFTHVVIGFVLLIISYLLLTSLEWTFTSKLFTGAALIFVGGKLASVTAKLKWHWPNIIRGVGIGIIVLSLLQSGFARMIGTGIDKLEEAAAGVVTPVQPLDPAEQARRVAVAKQEAEVAEAQRLAIIAAQQAAVVPPPERTEATKITYDCRGQYEKLTNCRNVKFGENEIYHTEVVPTIDPKTKKEELWCTFADPIDAGHWEHIAGRQFAFIPNDGLSARVTFFEVKKGEKTFKGIPCE